MSVSKLDFLEYVLYVNKYHYGVCVLHIMHEFHLNEKAASMRLLRYHKRGLLKRSRSKAPYGAYEYFISRKGLERIEYLRKFKWLLG